MANVTKNLIRVEFLKLLREKKYDDIKTAEIAKECEINRNTFYYHFKNKEELLDYILTEEKKKVDNFKSSPEGLLAEYIEGVDFIRKNKRAFTNLYYSEKRDEIIDYLESVTDAIISKYIKNNYPDINIENPDVNRIVQFISTTFLGNIINRLRKDLDDNFPIFTGKSQEFFDEFIVPALFKANNR